MGIIQVVLKTHPNELLRRQCAATHLAVERGDALPDLLGLQQQTGVSLWRLCRCSKDKAKEPTW